MKLPNVLELLTNIKPHPTEVDFVANLRRRIAALPDEEFYATVGERPGSAPRSELEKIYVNTLIKAEMIKRSGNST